jgi:hypothetical protein
LIGLFFHIHIDAPHAVATCRSLHEACFRAITGKLQVSVRKFPINSGTQIWGDESAP